MRSALVLIIAASRPHSHFFMQGDHRAITFILYFSAHCLLISVMCDAAQNERMSARALAAMHALSPLAEHLSFSSACSIPFCSSSNNARDAVFILWHVSSLYLCYRAARSLPALPQSPLLARAAAVVVACGLLPHVLPNVFGLFDQHSQLPLLFHNIAETQYSFDALALALPLHRLARASTAVVSWCLWVYFVVTQVVTLRRQAANNRAAATAPNALLPDFVLFLGHSASLSYHILRKLLLMFVWIAACFAVFYTLFRANLDDSDLFDLKWRVDNSTRDVLVVNISSFWPIPYAIFHQFPNPRTFVAPSPPPAYAPGLVSDAANTQTDPSVARNQTPIACSIDIHQQASTPPSNTTRACLPPPLTHALQAAHRRLQLAVSHRLLQERKRRQRQSQARAAAAVPAFDLD